jgi:hypothetical protein
MTSVQRLFFFLLVTSGLLAGCALPVPLNNPKPTKTGEVEETETPVPFIEPGATLEATFTPGTTKVISLGPTNTSAPTSTETNVPAVTPVAVEVPDFGLQAGSPAWLPNFARPDLGCNFLGVAGQVFDQNGTAVKMLVVEVGGSLGGNEILGLSLTGNAPTYGPAGYEIQVAGQPVGSRGSIWIRAFDLGGNPLSEKIFFDTFADCDRNLILINFVETIFPLPELNLYLPGIFKN